MIKLGRDWAIEVVENRVNVFHTRCSDTSLSNGFFISTIVLSARAFQTMRWSCCHCQEAVPAGILTKLRFIAQGLSK